MKVLGISMGRRNGNSEILLKHALKACEEEGLDVSFLRLHDYYIKPCSGCELCTKLNYSGQQIHCMYGENEDDYKCLTDQIKEADGIIFAAPAYHLMPPGIGTVMLNRCHSAIELYDQGLDHSRGQRRVCATIGVGGSDWTSLFMPILNFVATEIMGSRINQLVDQMKLHRTPAVGMVLCNEEALARARLLGINVAEELKKTGTIQYHGKEGICPICHNDIVVVRNGRLSCAICDYEGDPIIEDGKIKAIKWDGGIEVTRWSPYGREHHDAEQTNAVKFENGKYIFTEEQKQAMLDGRKKWGEYLDPVMPPNPVNW